jgi:hypothetical protein
VYPCVICRLNRTQGYTVRRLDARGIPSLSPEELAQLESNLLAEGCRDALVTWQGVLLDGHHRHAICAEHGIPFATIEAVGVHTRDEALDWIVRNQLGRRNLMPDQASYLRGKRYRLEKVSDPFNGNQHTSAAGGQNAHQQKTAERLAAEHGVDEKTIRCDAKYAEAIDTIAGIAGDDARQAILTGEINLPKAAVVALAEVLPVAQPEIEKRIDEKRATIPHSRAQGCVKGQQLPFDFNPALARAGGGVRNVN